MSGPVPEKISKKTPKVLGPGDYEYLQHVSGGVVDSAT
jgi:hypothetical protein